MKSIYKLTFDCERLDFLIGIFVAEDEDVKILVDNKIFVNFGEALGKHSQVHGNIEESEIIKVTDDELAINIFENYNLQSGYNPFEYPLFWEDAKKYFPDNYDDRYVYEAINLIKEKV